MERSRSNLTGEFIILFLLYYYYTPKTPREFTGPGPAPGACKNHVARTCGNLLRYWYARSGKYDEIQYLEIEYM
jgi:predicted membrane-bound mannosyltransferase